MGAEALIFTPAVGLAILRVLSLLLIPVLPLAALRRTEAAMGPARLGITPYIEIAAVAIGVLSAPLLLIGSTTDNIMGPTDIFRPNGPWDLDFLTFMTERALPLLWSPLQLLDTVLLGHASADVTRGTLLLIVAIAAVVGGPIALRRDAVGKSNGVRNLLLLMWGAYASVYTVAVLLWLANVLNFWCFLVLFAALLLVHD